jgi:hypothetical protein
MWECLQRQWGYKAKVTKEQFNITQGKIYWQSTEESMVKHLWAINKRIYGQNID